MSQENNELKTTNTLTCPMCGSTSVTKSTAHRSIAAPMGPMVSFDVEVDTCRSCGECGDFDMHNDGAIRDAEKRSADASIVPMLESLAREGCSMAYMERALSLPSRTIARWKSGDGISAPALAMLRMVVTYPWLLEVADAKYLPRFAASKLVVEAGKAIGNAIQIMVVGPISATNTGAGQVNTLVVDTQTSHGQPIQVAHVLPAVG